MNSEEKRIAIFIDADNAPADKFEFILSELAKHGVVNIRKAYGNWKSTRLKKWESILFDYSIQPIQQFDLSKGKNATDIALVIDAIDTLYTKNMDVFCIVSSDGDFTPLVTRILSEGKMVLGFGERKTPAAFVNACSTFLYLGETDNSQPEKDDETQVKFSAKELKSDTKLINLIRNAIKAGEDDNGWANLSSVGNHIKNQASFDPRNYGYDKLGELISRIDLFETAKGEKGGIVVRDKRRTK
ncbi:MAG: NYN domain-containing protein [Gammaproteobacteria bacterium]